MTTKNMQLEAIYDSRESFYGKARVVFDNVIQRIPTGTSKFEILIEYQTKIELYSYDTHVATYTEYITAEDGCSGHRFEILNMQSATTLRHIKEFARQFVPGLKDTKLTKAKLMQYMR